MPVHFKANGAFVAVRRTPPTSRPRKFSASNGAIRGHFPHEITAFFGPHGCVEHGFGASVARVETRIAVSKREIAFFVLARV